MDPEAAQRLRAAKDAHIDYQRRFVDGPVSKAIETNGYAGQYARDASAVPALAIRTGDEGYSTAKAYLRDSNNAPEMVEALTDRALAPLRSSLTPQGTVSPAKYAQWKKQYGPALRALDEADPGFASRYDSAAKATDLMVRAGALREQQLKAFQDKTTAKFLGATDPSEIHGLVGNILDSKTDGVTRMRDLVSKLKDDPDALAGLRRAGAAAMAQKFSNATKEAATGDQSLSATKLPQFVNNRRAALRELFPEKDIGHIDAIARVLDQKQLSTSATANKGTSQTSRDLAGLIKRAGEHAGHGHGVTTVLALAGDRAVEDLMEKGLEAVPTVALGATGAGALWALNRLRTKNAKADQAAIHDALMNPERFAHYTAKVSPDEAERRGSALSGMIRRQLIMQPIVDRAAQEQTAAAPTYARGGVIGGRGAVSSSAAERAADGMIVQADRIRGAQGRRTGALVGAVAGAA